MRKPLISLAAALILIAFGGSSAVALPVLADYFSIRATTSEDFELFAAGDYPSPTRFDGFDYASSAPIVSGLGTICRSIGQCLSDNDLLSNGSRDFSGFHPGTKVFGVRLSWVNPDQRTTLKVTVKGAKSTRVFTGFQSEGLVNYLAFFDQHGLERVSFEISDLPGPFLTNYGFDDVITSVRPVPVPVPLPAAMNAMSAGILGFLLFGAFRRRRIRRVTAVRNG